MKKPPVNDGTELSKVFPVPSRRAGTNGPFQGPFICESICFSITKEKYAVAKGFFRRNEDIPEWGAWVFSPHNYRATATAVLWRGQMKSSITESERAYCTYLSLVIGRKWVNITGTDGGVDPLSTPPERGFRIPPRPEV